MKTVRLTASSILLALLSTLGLGCYSTDNGVQQREVGHHIKAFCDGPNLIYRYEELTRGGITVIPDSPECKEGNDDH